MVKFQHTAVQSTYRHFFIGQQLKQLRDTERTAVSGYDSKHGGQLLAGGFPDEGIGVLAQPREHAQNGAL